MNQRPVYASSYATPTTPAPALDKGSLSRSSSYSNQVRNLPASASKTPLCEAVFSTSLVVAGWAIAVSLVAACFQQCANMSLIDLIHVIR